MVIIFTLPGLGDGGRGGGGRGGGEATFAAVAELTSPASKIVTRKSAALLLLGCRIMISVCKRSIEMLYLEEIGIEK